jgi:hypothetical protein
MDEDPFFNDAPGAGANEFARGQFENYDYALLHEHQVPLPDDLGVAAVAEAGPDGTAAAAVGVIFPRAPELMVPLQPGDRNVFRIVDQPQQFVRFRYEVRV